LAKSICYSNETNSVYGFESHPDNFEFDIFCYSKVITQEIELNGFWYELCDEFANSWVDCQLAEEGGEEVDPACLERKVIY
jgi:hypothetical protein